MWKHFSLSCTAPFEASFLSLPAIFLYLLLIVDPIFMLLLGFQTHVCGGS